MLMKLMVSKRIMYKLKRVCLPAWQADNPVRPRAVGDDAAAPDPVRFDRRGGKEGTCHVILVILQPKHHLTTAGMVHVTNLTPPGSGSTLVGRMGKAPIGDISYGACNQSSDTRE